MVRDAHPTTGAPEGNQNELTTALVSQPTQTETDASGPSRVIKELDAAVEEYAKGACDMGETVEHFDSILESASEFDGDQRQASRL